MSRARQLWGRGWGWGSEGSFLLITDFEIFFYQRICDFVSDKIRISANQWKTDVTREEFILIPEAPICPSRIVAYSLPLMSLQSY